MLLCFSCHFSKKSPIIPFTKVFHKSCYSITLVLFDCDFIEQIGKLVFYLFFVATNLQHTFVLYIVPYLQVPLSLLFVYF